MIPFEPLELLGLFVSLLATGAVAGLLAGLLGVGGGIVIVPVLVIVSDIFSVQDNVAMLVVVGTSLATIIPTSLSSARAHYKHDAIDFSILKSWAPGILMGALLGGLTSGLIGATGLSLVFGTVALLVSINLAIPKTFIIAANTPSTLLGRAGLSAPIGIISSWMGIGGGTLSVPVLTMMSVPVKRAVATASVFGLLIAIPAVLGFIWSGWAVEGRPPGSLGYVNVPAAIVIFSVSVFTAPVGARLAHSLEPSRLKRAFALFLAISAIRMLWNLLA